MHGMGVLDKISTSGFSCRRPFKCTCCCKAFAYALALPCQIVHDLNQSSWHVLCICSQEFLTSNMLSPCKFGFQNGPDLAFVRSRVRSSTVTSHYATSHVSLGLVSACISTVLTVQFTKFLPGVGSSQLACKPLTPQQRGRGLMSSATGHLQQRSWRNMTCPIRNSLPMMAKAVVLCSHRPSLIRH